MSSNNVRNLAMLETSAATSRVLNLRAIYREYKDFPEYQERPLFQNAALNRAIIVKHRLRSNERDDFPTYRFSATKVIFPIDTSDLRMGARFVFVGQNNFAKLITSNLNTDESKVLRDLETLRAVDEVPSLDPFLLREHLSRCGHTPANCYFQISQADVDRMLRFVESEIGSLVRMSFGKDGNSEHSAILTKKLLSNTGDTDTDALRLTLQMDHEQYREGIFCWKAFLYYKWQLKDIVPKATQVLTEIQQISPRGPMNMDSKVHIAGMRQNICQHFSDACDKVASIIAVYDNAYYMLTQKSDPQAFKNFLLSAPELFKALGERLGAVEHVLSFWRYRFPEGRQMLISPDQLIDIFMDFENSLDFGGADPGPARGIAR